MYYKAIFVHIIGAYSYNGNISNDLSLTLNIIITINVGLIVINPNFQNVTNPMEKMYCLTALLHHYYTHQAVSIMFL